jgi:hypothetical protein
MRHNLKKPFPKSKILGTLSERGITAVRMTNPEKLRVWETSDGKWFASLKHMAIYYKLGK